MMRLQLFAIIWGLLLLQGKAQQAITLDECLLQSHTNFPLQSEYRNVAEQSVLRLRMLNARYYPQMDLAGQFSWQNEVTHVDSPSPSLQMPMAPKDQYKAYVDVKQLIYDGGITQAAKTVERDQQRVQEKAVDVELYGIRQQVINAYYLALTIDEQLKQLAYRMEVLDKRLVEINSGVENGAVLQSEADAFRVEILKLQQDQFALEEGLQAALDVLNELTGLNLKGGEALVLPVADNAAGELARPELSLFDAQRQQLVSAQQLAGRQRMPSLAGFGQIGYGNPGFNMLKDEFDTFYMVGLRLSWRLWDWRETNHKKAVYRLQSESINTREAAFEKNIRLAASEIDSRIRRLERIMASDDEIIALRQNITQSAQSRLNNGTYTAADYIADLNAESVARLARELHRVELSKARRERMNLMGH